MSRGSFKAGLIIAAICPAVFIITAALSLLMPGCSLGGSGGPAGGCAVLGVSFNWLIGFATPAFVFSFFTVPIGLFIVFVGAFFSDKSS
jgi:hypothetical protein